MSILEFKIDMTGNLPIQTRAKTLDEMTRHLPQGFYTTFSTLSHGTKVLGLHAHLQRLYAPALEHGLIPSIDEKNLRTRIAELAKENLPKESRIRLILTKNDGAIYAGVQLFEQIPKQIYEDGVKVVTAELARQDPRVKDTGFISSSIEERKQLGRDVFEVLLTKHGHILEGMTSNIYVINGKTLVTAQDGILLGVTRHVILGLARGEGMSIEYHAPKINEKFDEAFLTSSSRGVVPIVSIDGNPVGEGKVGEWTNRLMKAYQEYMDRKAEEIAN
jgi:branched-chain amino acid aminotransferase